MVFSNIKSNTMQTKSKAGFIAKLQNILDNPQIQQIVSWSNHGNSFIIHQVATFQTQVLKSYFRHQRISSFVRQLNMYGFHKYRGDKDKHQYYHPLFIQRKPDNYCLIERKKTTEVTFNDSTVVLHQSFHEMSGREISNLPSIKIIQQNPQPQQTIATRFRLNGSQMTIRLNQNLTSLCQVEWQQQAMGGQSQKQQTLSIFCQSELQMSGGKKRQDQFQTLLFTGEQEVGFTTF